MQPNAKEAMEKLLAYDFTTALDIGSGMGNHAASLIQAGKSVTTIDHVCDPDMGNHHIFGDFTEVLPKMIKAGRKYDAIWMAHLLEHALDPHTLLSQCHKLLKNGGLLVITVPPLKHNIVGGHVNLFNEGLLLYRLILAGFNCKGARVGVYGYNISVIIKKEPITDTIDLHMDSGDIDKLSKFFPVPASQAFDGRTGNVNW